MFSLKFLPYNWRPGGIYAYWRAWDSTTIVNSGSLGIVTCTMTQAELIMLVVGFKGEYLVEIHFLSSSIATELELTS